MKFLASEIRAVISYVKQFSTAFNDASPRLIVIPPRPPKTAASIERGRALYVALDCIGCHGSDGRKGGFLADLKIKNRDISPSFVIPNLNKEEKRIPLSSVVLSSQRIDRKDALFNAAYRFHLLLPRLAGLA